MYFVNIMEIIFLIMPIYTYTVGVNFSGMQLISAVRFFRTKPQIFWYR
jgi:hypothetical protein